MSPLQMCWLAVTGATIVFLIVAAISALPKMKAAYTASISSIFLAASGITAFGSLAPLLSVAGLALARSCRCCPVQAAAAARARRAAGQ